MVGGLLVALAALVAWWAASAAGQPPTTRYVVATRPIGPGQVVEADDLGLVVVELPDTVRRSAFGDPGSVVGRVTLGPLGPGELVSASSLSDQAPPRGGRELTFSVDPAAALGGTLRPGDRIDVFATYGDGVTSQTLRVLAGVTVRRTTEADGSHLGEGDGTSVTVGIDREVAIETVVNATHAAALTLVRVNGSPDDPLDPVADRYRADADLTGAGQPGSAGAVQATEPVQRVPDGSSTQAPSSSEPGA